MILSNYNQEEREDESLLQGEESNIQMGTKSEKTKDSSQKLNSDNHTMWDAFEHILLFISLYIFTIFFSLLIHNFIDRWIPKTQGYRSTASYLLGGDRTIRLYLAAIIVSFPIFGFLFLRVTKRTMENSSLRKLKSRKILIYNTLVVTFLIGLATVIIIVYNFLGGNISLNFVAHFLTTLIISGSIFAYYLRQVKDDKEITF